MPSRTPMLTSTPTPPSHPLTHYYRKAGEETTRLRQLAGGRSVVLPEVRVCVYARTRARVTVSVSVSVSVVEHTLGSARDHTHTHTHSDDFRPKLFSVDA